MPHPLPRRSAALLLLALAHIASRPLAAAPGWQHIDLPGTGSYTLDYVPFSLPPTIPAPAIVFLHGSGFGPESWQNTSLSDIAEELGFVLVMPRAGEDLSFGIGADDAIVEAALAATAESVDIDTARVGLSGFSAGAAYALVLANTVPGTFNGVFAMGSPYRIVIRLANPSAPPPIHFEYGTNDPNYVGLQYQSLRKMFDRLGVPNELDLVPGLGHQVPPDESLRAGFGFLLARPRPTCAPSATALCLRGRFRVEATWQTSAGQGDAGVVQLTHESGYLWFFDPDNVEVSVKLLDACSYNQRFWMFAAGTTDVRVVLTVTDTLGGGTKTYVNPPGTAFRPVLDTAAFATCP